MRSRVSPYISLRVELLSRLEDIKYAVTHYISAMKFRHKALGRLNESDQPVGLPPEHVPPIRRILADLDLAVQPSDLAVPGYYEQTNMNAMANPPHPGETIRFECIEASGLTVTEAARLLGCSRPTLSRILNARAGISPEMAIALERQGWSNADFWVRRQAAFDLAQARRRLAA